MPRLIVDRYEVTGKLGEGGMGVVYRAWDPVLNQDVSIKLLKNIGPIEESAMRFQREARAASQLSHSNLAPVLDFGAMEDGTLYMVSKFIEGDTLSSRIKKKGPLSVDKGISLLRQTADCMAYIHGKGILHRDLKASNIIVDETEENIEAYVLDFGIAKLLEEHILEEGVTSAGTVLGSPMYMSPEQGTGRQVDFRSDIYSLGCMAYEILTGDVPFKADSIFDVIKMHGSEPVPPLASNTDRDDIPEDLEKLVYRMLSKEPKDRPTSMREVVSQLDGIMSDLNRRRLFLGKTENDENEINQVQYELLLKGSEKSKAGILLLVLVLVIGIPLAFLYFQNSNNEKHKQESKMIEAVKNSNLTISTELPTTEFSAMDANPKNQFLPYESQYPGLRRIDRNQGWKGSYDYSRLKEIDYDFYLTGYSEKESKGDIEKLLELKHFVGLSAFDSKVTDKDLKALSEKKNLVLLEFTNVHGFTTGGKGLSPLKNLPALSILKLADCNLDDKDLAQIGKLKALEILDLDYNDKLTANGLEELAKSRSEVSVLSLKKLSLSEEAMKSLANLKYLKQLHLSDTKVPDSGFKYLAKSPVEALDLTGTMISDIALSHLSKSKSLTTICLNRCNRLTKIGTLTFLKKTGCSKVSYIY